MKSELIIRRNEDKEFDHEIFEVGLRTSYNCLTVYDDEECSFLDNLKNKESFNNKYSFVKDAFKSLELMNCKTKHMSKTLEIWEYFHQNFDNILDTVDCISFDVPGNLIDYLKQYPILKDKPILLPYSFDNVDYKLIDELLETYKDYPNALVYNKYTNSYLTLNEAKKSMKEIEMLCEYIASLNLSPLETYTFVYDLIRGEDNLNNTYKFSTILKNLGFINYDNFIRPKNKNVRHQRNSIYIEDPKYGVKGYYYVDLLWDRKKDNTNNYLNSYKYFLKTKDEMDKLENYSCVEISCEEYSRDLKNRIDIFFKEYNQFLNDRKSGLYDEDEVFEYEGNFISEFESIITTINYLYKRAANEDIELIDTKELFENILDENINIDPNVIKKAIDKLFRLLNKPISAEIYIDLINNVRSVENNIDASKYPYNVKVLENIYKNSGWEFAYKHLIPGQVILSKKIDDDGVIKNNVTSNFDNYVDYELQIPSCKQYVRTKNNVIKFPNRNKKDKE